MECFQGSSCSSAFTVFLAESEYKGKAKFWTTKHFLLFFSINFSSFFVSVDFQAVRKQEKFHFFDEIFYRLAKRGIRNKKKEEGDPKVKLGHPLLHGDE